MATDSNATTTQNPIVAEAKQRATAVVLAYRGVEWEAVKSGEEAAVRALVSACELHDATRRFLAEEDIGAVGEKLIAGLERFYDDSVRPHMGDPLVVLQLSQLPAGVSQDGMESAATAAGTEEQRGLGLSPRSRPQVTVGNTVRMNTGCGHLYVTVNESEDGEPFELFNHMGKAGGCAASQNEAIGRLISYALRCGAQLEPLIKQLKGISCHRPAWGEDGKISSCSDAIGKALETYHQAREIRNQRGVGSGVDSEATSGNGSSNGSAARQTLAGGSAVAFESATPTGERWIDPEASALELGGLRAETSGMGGKSTDTPDMHRVQGACVDCGSQLSFEEGCVKCHSCGFTECG